MSGRNPRRDAFAILRRVEDAGAYASALLESRAGAYDDPRDLALLHEIVLGVLRRRRALDHAIARIASRDTGAIEPPVLTALRVGAYALLFLDRVPDFAAVDTAVALVKDAGRAQAAGFVNGVLRAIARDRDALLPADPDRGDVEGLALAHSHPIWWTRRVVSRLGWERASALLASGNEPAATTLAPWEPEGRAEDLAARLATEGVATAPCTFVPGALRVVSGVPQRTPAFREGRFFIQDEASQLAVAMFGERVGPYAADLCAAPGGKALGHARRASKGSLVVAADRNARRLTRLNGSIARLGATGIALVALDATTAARTLAASFDDVLVDAPCSGTGTLRRHPEIRWRLAEEDLPRHAERQGRILRGAAPLVAPGARLVYSVCSMEPEEGEEVVASFLSEHPEFRSEDPRENLPAAAASLVAPDLSLRTTPLDGGMDGFFAACLRRADGRSGRL